MKNQRVRSFTPRFVPLGWSLAAVIIAGFSGGTRLSADDTVDPNVKVVVVNGAGTDMESAKKDACREAVRQVVGAYVTSKVEAENDELIEDKVISLSSGFVEKIETLKESQADGLVRVRLRATVRISKVLDSLKANRIAVIEVDGGSLGAQLLTTADQKKGEAELIEAAFDGFPAKWFKASPTGKTRLGERGEGSNVSVIVTVTIEPDYEGFVASAAKLDAALRATERPHGKFEVDATALGPGMSATTSQQSATAFLSGVVTGGSRSGQQGKPEAVSFIDSRSAFPELLQSHPHGSIDGKRLMPPGFIPVAFPVKFRGKGRQATWHWYGMKLSDAKKYLAPRFRKPLTCRTVLIDGSSAEIALDTCEIQCMGVGGMKYWEDWQANDWNNQAAVAVAPAAIVGNHVRIDWLVPTFTCERSIVLEEDEVRRLTNVAVTLE